MGARVVFLTHLPVWGHVSHLMLDQKEKPPNSFLPSRMEGVILRIRGLRLHLKEKDLLW